MNWIKALFSLLAAGLLTYLLARPIGTAVPFPLGEFLDPFQGFWRNAEPLEGAPAPELKLPGLSGPVEIIYDERGVPHIFARSTRDLYVAQGYVTARDRLWQMEFQVMAAAGRLTELVGRGTDDAVLNLDRTARRKGMTWAAERQLQDLDRYPEMKACVEAYTEGVNAYISQLTPATLPLEYRLLNYRPEPWSVLKSMLVRMNMANDLAAGADDVEHTNALRLLGRRTFDALYPALPYDQSPIVPADVKYNARTAAPRPERPEGYAPDSLLLAAGFEKPDPMLGSNNWAVAGAKSATGRPMLAGDPHLTLTLPSVWYEIQLHGPDVHVYGNSLPGAPNVILGFNDSIAWSITNAGRDVMDYYRVTYRDGSEAEYRYEDQWLPTETRLETHRIKGGGVFVDTVRYTRMGPVIYDKRFGKQPAPLALRWMAHEQATEALAFYKLNRARNYREYVEAISYHICPAQNFVFASAAGDIAIWQQGRFVNPWPEQGRFVLDGSKASHQWSQYIPQPDNPHILNPARGFVSSANQHPASPAYPYYYTGSFDIYRSRRLNALLAAQDTLTADDMKRFQLDNFGLMAAEVLPVLLGALDSSRFSALERGAYQTLQGWDYQYTRGLAAPSIFQRWWRELRRNIWADEFERFEKQGIALDWPSNWRTAWLLRDSAQSRFYLKYQDTTRWDRRMLAQLSFREAIDSLAALQPDPAQWTWGVQKTTDIRHLTRILGPLGRLAIPTDGNNDILNATGRTAGPSWRMVVQLGPRPEAQVIYPGGQSGNPGSPLYENMIDDWAQGRYYSAWFMQRPDESDPRRRHRQVLTP
ncbi:MAG: penicillin acylase family protein [Bacteroidia bacterium]|nr:penicillin acylase family protein [Bacteroidia bacterium]